MTKPIAYLVLMVALMFTGCDRAVKPVNFLNEDSPSGEPRRLSRLAIPEKGAYAGAYIEFGEEEDEVTLEGLARYQSLVGKHQAVIAFSNYWGKQHFPEQQLRIIGNYGAVPLIFWLPWDRWADAALSPEQQSRTSAYNLNAILAGKWDAYIDNWALQAKAQGRPILLAFGIEMNGNWFPWSGYFFGGGNRVPGPNGELVYEGPYTYRKAFRYIAQRIRATGATNVHMVFHANNSSNPDAPWNRIAEYYPGDDVVDWIGLSAYGQQYRNQNWLPFEVVLPKYYEEICAVAPNKPFILAEWGIAEFPKSGDKAEWITTAYQQFETRFPRMKAMVFWHERWQNHDKSYSNLRANSSEKSLKAFRAGMASPYWLSDPALLYESQVTPARSAR